tara:strand:+ start:775 stop:1056 length:282 start_codon:yes stop_codon:yes gene_type:complete
MRRVGVVLIIENVPADWRARLKTATGIEIPEHDEFLHNHVLVITPEQLVDLMRVQWAHGWLIRVSQVYWVTTNERVGGLKTALNWVQKWVKKV